MNKLFLLGNLTEDPAVKKYHDNPFTVFCVAVSDGYGDKKKTHFFDCIASGKTGENIAKYFEKGKPILVEGKLYTTKNKESGFKEIKISVYGFEFLPGGGDGKKTTKKSKKDEEPYNKECPF